MPKRGGFIRDPWTEPQSPASTLVGPVPESVACSRPTRVYNANGSQALGIGCSGCCHVFVILPTEGRLNEHGTTDAVLEKVLIEQLEGHVAHRTYDGRGRDRLTWRAPDMDVGIDDLRSRLYFGIESRTKMW
jgi:hypothetical protein